MIKGISRFYTTGHKIEEMVSSSSCDGGFGGQAHTWEEKLTFSARLRPLSGDKRLSADKLTEMATHKLYSDVLEFSVYDRYVDPDGRKYRITYIGNVMNMNNHMETELQYVEVWSS